MKVEKLHTLRFLSGMRRTSMGVDDDASGWDDVKRAAHPEEHLLTALVQHRRRPHVCKQWTYICYESDDEHL